MAGIAMNRDGLRFGEKIELDLADRVAELVAGVRPDDEAPLEYEIEDVREMYVHVDEAASRGDFNRLRRSKNGRELLALWQARSIIREGMPTSQDAVDGFAAEAVRWGAVEYDAEPLLAPVDEDAHGEAADPKRFGISRFTNARRGAPNASAVECRLHMDDEAFRYSHRCDPDERWEGEFAGYQSQDDFIRGLTEQRRVQLAHALQDYYGSAWNSPKVAEWVKGRIEKKHGNLLRGYCSCLYSIKRRLAALQTEEVKPRELVLS